ncbi:hypothetical protein ATCC90586_008919 [Pythium insidiosum]|nr:hypothetical protein ATCC90586_008919 [Pythium insidiosum]
MAPSPQMAQRGLDAAVLPAEPAFTMQHCSESEKEVVDETTTAADGSTENDDDDEKPLLQEVKLTRTGSKKAVQGAKVLSDSSAPSDTLVAVTSITAEARIRRIRALGYIVLAAINISSMSACVKYATGYVTSHEAVLWRWVLAFFLNYSLVRYNRVDLRIAPAHRRILLLRCFVGVVSISLQFYAFSKMVLTDAVVIIFTSPVITFLLGALLLREPVERIDFACALLSYAGVLFVTRPASIFPAEASHKPNDTTAVIAALGAAFTQACAYIATRKLHEVHFMAIMHYFSIFGVIFASLTTLAFGVRPQIPSQPGVVLALVGSACFSTVGLLFLTLGFQQEKAGIASVMRYFDVVFVFILDITFLGESVNGYSILGGCIILSGAVIIAIRRSREKK